MRLALDGRESQRFSEDRKPGSRRLLTFLSLLLFWGCFSVDSPPRGEDPVDHGEGPVVSSETAVSLDTLRQARAQAVEGLGKCQQEDFEACHDLLQAAWGAWPDHHQILYGLAVARARLGDREGALKAVTQLASVGCAVPLNDEPAFDALREAPEFRAAEQALAALETPVGDSQEVARLAEKDLIPESVAFDAKPETSSSAAFIGAKLCGLAREARPRISHPKPMDCGRCSG